MSQTDRQKKNWAAVVSAITSGGRDEAVPFEFPKQERRFRKRRKTRVHVSGEGEEAIYKTVEVNHPARERWLQKMKRRAAKRKEEVHEVETTAENLEIEIENR